MTAHSTTDTRYSSELHTLFAWDSSRVNDKYITKYFSGDKDPAMFIRCQTHKDAICRDMSKRNFPKVGKVDWQANNNRNTNGSPADIVFLNHPVGGVSVKHGSDIVGNFGTKEFSDHLNRPKGVDLFRFLAPEQFDALLKKVKTTLLKSLRVGDVWTKDEEDESHYGKYSITCLSENYFKIKYGNSTKSLTLDQIMSGEYLNKSGKLKNISGGCHRVFGDYYQTTKGNYEKERNDLYQILYPKIETLFESTFSNNKERMCSLGGFTEQPYYLSDLKNNKVFYVPSINEVKDSLIVEVFDKEKEKTFGSGFELACKIQINESSVPATIDFYVCYNSGTFNRGPVIKFQGLAGKENLWTEITG